MDKVREKGANENIHGQDPTREGHTPQSRVKFGQPPNPLVKNRFEDEQGGDMTTIKNTEVGASKGDQKDLPRGAEGPKAVTVERTFGAQEPSLVIVDPKAGSKTEEVNPQHRRGEEATTITAQRHIISESKNIQGRRMNREVTEEHVITDNKEEGG